MVDIDLSVACFLGNLCLCMLWVLDNLQHLWLEFEDYSKDSLEGPRNNGMVNSYFDFESSDFDLKEFVISSYFNADVYW